MNSKYLFLLMLVLFYGCSDKKDDVPDLDLISVKSGEYWGYINKDGAIKINPQFKYAFAFMDNAALVLATDNKFGFINEEGKFLINPIFKSALSYSEGLALVVKENSQIEFIDKQGNTKITLAPEIEVAYSLSDGLALVESNNKYGYIDKGGSIVIQAIYERAGSFHEGMARVRPESSKDSKALWGYINKKGEMIITPQFEDAMDFSDDLALVSNGKQFGYIDKEGKYVINPQFDDAGEFNNGLAVVKQGSLYGYIDKKGKFVINPQFKQAGLFYDNDFAAVTSSDGKYGYIDKDGKYSINPQFDDATRFYSNLAIVRLAGKFGLIDRSGKMTVNPQYDNVQLNKDTEGGVYSDFFDLGGTTSYMLNGTTNNSFSGESTNSSFKMLNVKYPALNQSNYYSFRDFTAVENKNIRLTEMDFFFKDGLLTSQDSYTDQQTYDAASGGYITTKVYSGSTTSLNENITLMGMRLYYSLQGKAVAKQEEVYKDLINQLKTKYSFTDATLEGYSYALKNNSYSIAIEKSSNVITITVLFDKV